MILHSEVMILNSDIHWNMTKQTCWSITIQYDHWSFQHGNHHLSVLHFLTITVLVGGARTILKNMSSSMGRMTHYILWKIKNVWNHQPACWFTPTWWQITRTEPVLWATTLQPQVSSQYPGKLVGFGGQKLGDVAATPVCAHKKYQVQQSHMFP